MRVYLRAELLALRARAADPAPEAMNARTQVLKQLVRESQYVVDADAVAKAIVERLAAGRSLAEVSFRASDEPGSSRAR